MVGWEKDETNADCGEKYRVKGEEGRVV